jgi:3-oxoacyl-[acyl-carrier-protein] synthase-3
VATRIGKVVGMDEWAELAKIPNRRGEGTLDGARVERILGIEAKSWDPDLFRRIETIVSVGEEALRSACVEPAEIDAAIVVTCSPYQIMLDQDAFQLLRALKLPDTVVPLQLSAGCGGLARAMATASMLNVERALIIAYNLASCVTGDGGRGVHPMYQHNDVHPLGDKLWASAGIFSDAAAALVIERREGAGGVCFYSRDSHSFGDEPGFEDPLIHYLGGGALHPPGSPRAAELSHYGMNSREVKRYYSKGMMLNHETLRAYRPRYVEEVRRIYTHQASPALIEDFARLAGLPPEKAPTNARRFGNLVSPCTVKMLDDDLRAGHVRNGDEVCVSVVGAGPERGAFLLPVNVAAARALSLPRAA